MTSILFRAVPLALVAAALLSGCVGWGHPMYGDGYHHGRRYEDRPYDRPMERPRDAPAARCTDDAGRPAPCPLQR